MKRFVRLLLPLLLLSPVSAGATLLRYEVRLVDSEGELSFGEFSVAAAEIAAQQTLVDVVDFEVLVNGVLYSNTYPTALNPMPGVTVYGMEGDLVAIEPPYVHSQGSTSVVNFRLLRDGTWLRDVCFPIETCNPDYGSGTYTLALLSVPEPASGALLALGLTAVTLARSRIRSVESKAAIRS